MSWRFSVIIVHRNGAELLLETLAALDRARDARADEVLLVDNGSRDDSLERVRAGFPLAAIIANPCNNGFARACNQGIARAAVRASAIREAGSLDNDFFYYYEETEWCHRLRAHGRQVLIEPAARITHLKGMSTRGQRRGEQIEALRSRLTFYRKTMAAPLAILLTVSRFPSLLLNAAANLLATILALGLHARVREKTAIYFLQLAWLALGCPERWGLPDKCPRGYTGTAS